MPGSCCFPLSLLLCDLRKLLEKEDVLVFPANNDLVDSVKSGFCAISFMDEELTRALLNSGLDGEKGDPERRLPGVADGCCGVGEKPTVYREVDSGEAE